MASYQIDSFSNSLSAQEVLHLMANTPLPTLIPKDRLDFEHDIAHHEGSMTHTLVLRNLSSQESDTLLSSFAAATTATTFGDSWFVPHLQHPIFHDHNPDLPEIPPLHTPPKSSSATPVDIFSSCRFTFAHTKRYQVIATLFYGDDIFPDVSPHHDRIVVEVIPPPLPANHTTYTNLPTAQAKRANLLHHTLLEYAQHMENMHAHDPKDSAHVATNFQNIIYPNALTLNPRTSRLRFAFTLPATESTAGSQVIPAVLATLHFLFPALSPNTSTYYDIMQPHAFAYTFRLRNLAGWSVYGGVNMLVYDFPSSYVLEEPVISPLYSIPYPTLYDTYTNSYTTFDILPPAQNNIPLVRHTTLQYGSKIPNAIHTAQKRAELPGPSVLRLRASFLPRFLDKLKEIQTSQTKKFTKHIKNKYAPHMKTAYDAAPMDSHILQQLTDNDWLIWMFIQGADMLLQTYHVSHDLSTQNRLLHSLWTHLNGTTQITFPPSDVLSLSLLFYQCCHSVASVVIAKTGKSKSQPDKIKGSAFHTQEWTKKIIKGNAHKSLVLPLSAILTFLHTCRVPMLDAAPTILSSFNAFNNDIFALASFIFKSPKDYIPHMTTLLPKSLDHFQDVISGAHLFFPEINDAHQLVPLTIRSNYLEPDQLIKPLAYALFRAELTYLQ